MNNRSAVVTLLGPMLVWLLAAPGCATTSGASAQKAPPRQEVQERKTDVMGVAAVSELRISFKLDPRLSGATYGGEHWVPSTNRYTGINGQDTVEAQTRAVDRTGAPVVVSADWSSSDPTMVTVSPAKDGRVTIKVQRAGESKLRVAAQGSVKELSVKAKYLGKTIQVEIDELPAAKPDGAAIAAPPPVGSVPSPAIFEYQKQRLSYAVGMSLAKALEAKSVEVDEGLLIQGLQDTLSGQKTLLTDGELRSTLVAFQASARNARAAPASKERVLESHQQGEAFLAANKQKAGVVTLPSGLQYKIVAAGHGPTPAPDDSVDCKYHATLIDGTEFDQGGVVTFTPKSAIKGWAEALPRMPAGSRWQLFVPPELAYGERGASRTGVIGPGDTLIFDLELLSVRASAAVAKTVRIEPKP